MISSIKRSKLFEEVSGAIKEEILSGVWREGERIPTEEELAAKFGVGRNTIREAIKSLQLAGMLVSSAGKGTYVTADALTRFKSIEMMRLISDESYYADLIETRMIIEPKAAEMAALRRTDEQIAEAAATIERMKGCSTREEISREGHIFHNRIVEMSRNHIIIALYESISTQLLSQRTLDFLTLEIYREGIGEHSGILSAVKAGDAPLAQRLMYEHLQRDYSGHIKKL